MKIHSRTIVLTLFLTLALALAPAVLADAVTYGVDAAHSGVTFKVRHFFTQVPGHFDEFDGTIVYDAEDPTKSSVEFTVQAASIDTGNEKRDGHLRSPDFFDVENHPTVTFQSTDVKVHEDDTLHVTGDFTLRGVTQKLTIPVSVLGVMEMQGSKIAGFSAEFTIDRKDFGVSWNRALDQGGTILGDEVAITVSVEAKQEEEAAASE